MREFFLKPLPSFDKMVTKSDCAVFDLRLH